MSKFADDVARINAMTLPNPAMVNAAREMSKALGDAGEQIRLAHQRFARQVNAAVKR